MPCAKKPKIAGKAPDTALPDAGKKVQQGGAADLQGNVGNSGVKDMIDAEAKTDKKAEKAPVRDPGSMSRTELAARAKADAQSMADKKEAGSDKKKKAAPGAETQAKPKQQAETQDKLALEKEAAQKKK